MKAKYLLLVLALLPVSVFAEDDDNTDTGANIVTSQAYVTSQLETKQNLIYGTSGTVITNTGTPGSVGSKPVYQTGGTWNAGQQGALLEAGQANTAIQNGLNAHVTCAPGAGTNASDCTLWRVNTLNGTYMP